MSTTPTFTDKSIQKEIPLYKVPKSPSLAVMLFIIIAEASLFFTAWLWAWYSNQDFTLLMTSGMPMLKQVLIGCSVGLVSALLMGNMAKLPYFSSVVDIFTDISREHGLGLRHWILISFLAGICEEPLFRAMLQPHMGVWLGSEYAGLFSSSFLFIALHGYFSMSNSRMTVFACFLFLISILLGLLAMHAGMISAIAAHAVFDLFIIIILRKRILAYQ